MMPSSAVLSRKQPRDFVHIDEFWEADASWPHYYVHNHVWIYADEYRAELVGDEDYSRIIINAGNDQGWIYSRRLTERDKVLQVLQQIERPVSELQLQEMGFSRWAESHIY